MAETFTLIASTVLTSTTSSITFSSIPATYTDLLLKFSTRANQNDSADAFDTILKFNNSAANLTFKSLRGDGTGVNFNSLTDRMLRTTNPSNYTASVFSNVDIYIADYLSSNTKQFMIDGVLENNAPGSAQIFMSGTWANSSAINQIAINPNTSGAAASFVAGSSAYLYGITN